MRFPPIAEGDFATGLRAASPEPLSDRTVAALWAHYQLLRDWGRGLSLVGPGTAGELVGRHYGESLAALPLVSAGVRSLVDVGSGAGFPGFVLAAARPELDVWLVESRQRKWAFLRTAAARAALSCHCLNARVSAVLPPELPGEFDLLTLRAVKLPTTVLGALCARLGRSGALLWWRGGGRPELPAGFTAARALALPGSERRRIVEVRRRP